MQPLQHLALAYQQRTGTETETNRSSTSGKRTSLVPQLRQLAHQLGTAIQSGQTTQARYMAHRYNLPPIAWGFLASCLQQQHIPGDVIESVLS